MILAVPLRTMEVPGMKPWDKHYYLCDHFKDVFHELGLLSLTEHQRQLQITLTSDGRKVDLDQSAIIRKLKQRKAGE